MLMVSRETLVADYLALLERWGSTINLVSAGELDRTRLAAYILMGFAVVPHLPPGLDRLIDLGSGQGFPAIPIAIATGIMVELIEADRRKAAFLTTVLSKLKLNGRVWSQRIENTKPGPAACVTAQALAPLPKLIRLAQPHLQPAGVCLFIKGEGAREEIGLAQQSIDCHAELIPLSTPPSCLVKVSAIR